MLLVVLMLTSGLALIPVALTAAGLDRGRGCLGAAGVGTGEVPPDDVLSSAAYQSCVEEHGMVLWWAGPATPGVLVVLACGLFFVLPVWKTRRKRVVPLEAVDHDGRILSHVRQLAQVSGLERIPRVVIDPAASSMGAAVFGRTGRPTICVHGGLLARRTAIPQDFDAVLLHELAHIRNRDVTLTYATVALWRTFIAVVLVPYAVGFAILLFNACAPGKLPYDVGLPAWRALALPVFVTVVVYLARSDVLRTREFHADLTAARWGAQPRAWEVTEPAPPAGALSRAVRSFTQLWRTHPQWASRRAALADSTPLFEAPGLLMFLTGAAVVTVNGRLWSYVGYAGRVGQWQWNLAMALPCAVLVTGIAGTVLWRSTVHRLRSGRHRLKGAGAGLWLGVGMTVGELFENRITILRWLPGEPAVLLLLTLSALAFTWWTVQCSHLWASVWQGRTLRTPMMLTLAGACLGMCAWLWWWQSSGVVLANVPGLLGGALSAAGVAVELDPTGEHTTILTTAGNVAAQLNTTVAVPLALPAITALWLLPLLAWAVHSLPAIGQRQAALLPGNPVVTYAGLPPLRRILSAGLFGAAVSWAAMVGVKGGMHGWQPPVVLRGSAGIALYQYGMSAALLAGATVAALTASLLVGRYRLIAALIAAHIAALVGYGGLWMLIASDGCLSGISTLASACDWRPVVAWQAFQYLLSIMLILVAVGSIAVAGSVAAVRSVLSWFADPGHSGQADYSTSRLNTRRLAVACTWAVATGLSVALLTVPLPGKGSSSTPSGKPAAASPLADHEASTQAQSWYSLGGQEILARYERNLGKLLALGPEAQKSPDRTSAVIIQSRLLRICTEFRQIAAAAGAYFPVPAPHILPSWKTFTTEAAKGGRHCLTALRHNDAALLTTGVQEINKATRAADIIKAWVTASRAGLL
ncbi:M48 family metallopeptidase [Streptomyces parvus]|uniref:M48 family metallopeptidase n=1 Tax=Streptomyces parvus TaxID=66428 RepID=UPI0037102063